MVEPPLKVYGLKPKGYVFVFLQSSLLKSGLNNLIPHVKINAKGHWCNMDIVQFLITAPYKEISII